MATYLEQEVFFIEFAFGDLWKIANTYDYSDNFYYSVEEAETFIKHNRSAFPDAPLKISRFVRDQ